jgi:hypothetical protein
MFKLGILKFYTRQMITYSADNAQTLDECLQQKSPMINGIISSKNI